MNDQRTSDRRVPKRIKEFEAWGLFNWQIPRGTFRTRREAIEDAEIQTGEPWAECRRYYTVQKVKVTPL